MILISLGYNENMMFLEEIYLELQALKRLHYNIFRSILRMDLKIRKLIKVNYFFLNYYIIFID